LLLAVKKPEQFLRAMQSRALQCDQCKAS
jgi:hypothetical protein